MWKLLAVLAFISAVSATPVVRHHYQLGAMKAMAGQSTGGRIVGGADTRIEDHPFQVALFYNSRFTCGGSIFNPTTIISAAHCTSGRNHGLFGVLAGETDNTVGVLNLVSQVIEHPQYDDNTLENDIVILRLAVALVYSDRIQPAVMPTPNFVVQPNQPATLAGWGTMEWGTNQFPSILQAVTKPTMTNEVCQEIYNEEELFESNVCAGEFGRDACQGDSGGPLKYNGVQIGIVSWGYYCAFEYPTVYTRVSDFLSFIINNSN